MSDFLSDDKSELFEEELGASSAPPVPEPKAAAKRAAKQESGPDGPPASKRRAKAKAKAGTDASADKGSRESYHGLMCTMCEVKPSYKKNPYCNNCKSDVDAMLKDAKVNQWLDKFEECKKKPAVFRKLLRDFQAQCPSQGPGKKRPVYGRARAIETIAREMLSDEGTRFIKADYFQFERHYKAMQLDGDEINEKWKARLADGICDRAGENAAFPERVLLKVEDYIDTKNRKRRSLEIQREGAADKGLLDDDKAEETLSSGFDGDWSSQFFGPGGAEMKRSEAAAAAADKAGDRSKQRRASFGSNSLQSEESGNGGSADAVTDLIVSRLRAYEEARDSFQKMKASFVEIHKKVSEEVEKIQDDRGLIPEYRAIATQRLRIADAMLSTENPPETIDAKIQELLSELPMSPVPNNSLLVCEKSLAAAIQGLKSCKAVDSLGKDIENCKGCIQAWSVLGQSLQSAMTETTKAIRECTKREKKKEKAAQKKQGQGPAGPAGVGAAYDTFFEKISDKPRELTVLTAKGFLSTHDDCEEAHVIRAAKAPGIYAKNAAFDSRLDMFKEQFSTSQACISTGRTFMKIGESGRLLVDEYAGWAECTNPVKPDTALFVPGLVGILKERVFWSIVESCSFRHVFLGKLDVVTIPLCKLAELGISEDIGAISRKALNDLDDKLIQVLVLEGKATRCTLTPSDILYVPPLSAVWERTLEAPCAYTSFKWLPGGTEELSLRIDRLIALPGWSATESLTKSLQTLQSMQKSWEKAKAANETAARSNGEPKEVGAQRCVT
ncbi:unnamed protein product [Symbiodinium sp. CCMP2592]|nr:unnamed protein product [Symbiodinium sp. CCMP2592]